MLSEQGHQHTIRSRAVGMVLDVRHRGRRGATIPAVAQRLGISQDTLRRWVAQAGAAVPDEDRVTALTRRLHALQRENEILRAASDFFARELDPQFR
ncbi:transposase [Krasilnikovia sp. MM14-A1259]|uniref:transposase n=1 Tax=Krasilnikovia sp. MM14-A1259 TaxID=3373539 RepID=UPI0037FE80FC